MSMSDAHDRAFRVRTRHEDAHHGRTLLEPSFEAAAIAYVEQMDWPAGEPTDPHAEVAVVVRDLGTGHEHSFVVHLDHGEVSAAA